MRVFSHLLACVGTLPLWISPVGAQQLPHLQPTAHGAQLIVDGQPYLAIGGELHNSSASSPAYMAPIWAQLARNHVKTVISVASWELVEPREGQFDFSAVDDQIRMAQAHGIHLVLIWFGGFKNADSSYTPSWVRRDTARFPRVERDPAAKPHGIVAYLGFNPTVSVFGNALLKADSRAFSALMHHLKQTDTTRRVIMVQVENETGLLGDSRDRSPSAAKAWSQPVPPTLLTHLRAHNATLRSDVATAWQSRGRRMNGTWEEVFGTDKIADEIFMAWSFGTYVDHVARAGAVEYPLPMYTNAWLGRTPGAPTPGDYPSGGPVAHMIDIWKAAAPTLAFLSPDIYVDNVEDVLADYKRPDNPLFVPEAKEDPGNLFLALGQYSAIGFSPFGIEDVGDDSPLVQAYTVLGDMTSLITQSQASGTIRGFRITKNQHVELQLNGYKLSITGPMSTLGAMGAGTGAEAHHADTGYGMVFATGKDEFTVVGRSINIRFSSPDAKVEIDSTQEGAFDKGQWVARRTLNGDERYALFPNDQLRIVRFTLQKH